MPYIRDKYYPGSEYPSVVEAGAALSDAELLLEAAVANKVMHEALESVDRYFVESGIATGSAERKIIEIVQKALKQGGGDVPNHQERRNSCAVRPLH